MVTSGKQVGWFDSDTCLGSAGHYMKAPCTEPCGNSTCLPCPQGTFLTRGNHFKTDCTRCQACDEGGEGPAQGSGGSCGQAIQKAGLGPACGCEVPVISPLRGHHVFCFQMFSFPLWPSCFTCHGLWSAMSCLLLYLWG